MGQAGVLAERQLSSAAAQLQQGWFKSPLCLCLSYSSRELRSVVVVGYLHNGKCLGLNFLSLCRDFIFFIDFIYFICQYTMAPANCFSMGYGASLIKFYNC